MDYTINLQDEEKSTPKFYKDIKLLENYLKECKKKFISSHFVYFGISEETLHKDFPTTYSKSRAAAYFIYRESNW